MKPNPLVELIQQSREVELGRIVLSSPNGLDWTARSVPPVTIRIFADACSFAFLRGCRAQRADNCSIRIQID